MVLYKWVDEYIATSSTQGNSGVTGYKCLPPLKEGEFHMRRVFEHILTIEQTNHMLRYKEQILNEIGY